jgi:hypothetical protein
LGRALLDSTSLVALFLGLCRMRHVARRPYTFHVPAAAFS